MRQKVTIVLEIEDDANLQANMQKFVCDNKLTRYASYMLYDAINNGAIFNAISTGKADMHYEGIE